MADGGIQNDLNTSTQSTDVPSLDFGPDTEELLWRVANIRRGILDVSRLKITSLPDLPSGLQKLYCYRTHLTSLPDLPAGLQELWCSSTQLTSLPDLPAGLQKLWCYNTHLTSLPDLPSGLQALHCSSTHMTSLPDLPSGLQELWYDNTPLILQRGKSESIAEYNNRWRMWREEGASKKRCQERSRAVHEELVAAAWNPHRVEKWLATGGFELLEAL